MSEHTCNRSIKCGNIWNRYFSPCGKKAKFQDETGNWFCGIHSPAAQARRDAKSDALYEKAKAEHNAKANKFNSAIAELEAWRDRFNGYEYRAGKIVIKATGN